MHVFNGYWQDFFEERHAEFTIGSREQDTFTGFTGKDEVGLDISNSSSLVNDFRPYINEFSIFELGDFGAFSPPRSPAHELSPVRFNSAAMDATQKSFNRICGDAGKAFLVIFDTPRNTLWRTAFPQRPFHKGAKFRMPHDLHSLILGVFAPHICFVVGLR